MPVEIERKFLVASDSWREHASGQRYCQGYLSKGDDTVRVRRAGPRAFLTIKGSGERMVRPEFEYEIPVEEAEEMFKLCRRPLIEKTRYEVLHQGSSGRWTSLPGRTLVSCLLKSSLSTQASPWRCLSVLVKKSLRTSATATPNWLMPQWERNRLRSPKSAEAHFTPIEHEDSSINLSLP
jgi:hypothetical protein